MKTGNGNQDRSSSSFILHPSLILAPSLTNRRLEYKLVRLFPNLEVDLMIVKFLSSIFLLLSVVIVSACNSAESGPRPLVQQQSKSSEQVATSYADGVRRITIAEFEELRSSGNVFIADVRSQAAYDQGHIPGAKLIPVGEVANRINEFPRDKTIVTYCS